MGALLAVVVIALVPPLRRAVALVASKAILVVLAPTAPSIEDFESLPQGSKLLASDGSVLADLEGGQRREQVRLDSLPARVPRAVLAAEGVNFYEDAGVDAAAVFRALLLNTQACEQAPSTIPAQLA